jgi:hypothetical protein
VLDPLVRDHAQARAEAELVLADDARLDAGEEGRRIDRERELLGALAHDLREPGELRQAALRIDVAFDARLHTVLLERREIAVVVALERIVIDWSCHGRRLEA